MKCCLCGDGIRSVKWAIRDYVSETYWQWVLRHVETVSRLRVHKEDGSLPVCLKCYLRAKKMIVQGEQR